MSERFSKIDIIGGFVKEHGHMATRTLSKLIMQEYPKLFPHYEAARSTVREIRGEIGVRKRSLMEKRDIYSPAPNKIDPNKLPRSYVDVTPSRPFIIPTDRDRALVISDIHAPYHDNVALSIALNYGVKHKANCVIINGDLIDFHKISRWQKNPMYRDVHEELETARQILRVIRDTFPEALILFLEGNHDARWPNYLAQIPELAKDPDLTLERRLKLDELNITYLPSNRYAKFRKLPIIHGHQFRGSSPVNAARGAFLQSLESVLVGHHHQASTHPNRTAFSGKLMIAHSSGCLCDLNPAYSPFSNRTMHGFVFLYGMKNGKYRVDNKWIYKGEILNGDLDDE